MSRYARGRRLSAVICKREWILFEWAAGPGRMARKLSSPCASCGAACFKSTFYDATIERKACMIARHRLRRGSLGWQRQRARGDGQAGRHRDTLASTLDHGHAWTNLCKGYPRRIFCARVRHSNKVRQLVERRPSLKRARHAIACLR